MRSSMFQCIIILTVSWWSVTSHDIYTYAHTIYFHKAKNNNWNFIAIMTIDAVKMK